jgi:cell division protein FtsA
MSARVDEVMRMIKKRLVSENVLNNVGAGVVLTGGGAHMKGIVPLAEKMFGLPCAIGKPRGVSGLVNATEGPEYATCIGMVQYGFRYSSARRNAGLGGLIRRMFGSSHE